MIPRPLCALFLSVIGLVGCRSSEAVPQLLSVIDVGPRVIAQGDALEIAGSGFPAKRAAHITLVGTIYRPGQEPREDVSLEVLGTATTPSKVEVPVGDALLDQACGQGDSAVHATFRGAVEVSFAAVTPGALPITGTVHDVVIDVRAPVRRRSTAEAQVEEGGRVLALVGVHPAPDAPITGGVVVAEVDKDCAADQAGIAAGDVITSLDGWTVLDASDVVPSGRSRFATFGVRRGDDPGVRERTVALHGYRPRGSTDLLGVALVLGTAAAAILFFASPLGRALTWLERWAGRAGPRRGRHAVSWIATSAHALFGGGADPMTDLWPTLIVLGSSALVAAVPFARSFAGVAPDLGAALALAVTLALALALTAGRSAVTRRWALWPSVRLAAWTLLHHLPSAVALACAVLATGSVTMSDVVSAQGGAPWQWLVVRTPAGPFLLALTLWPAFLEVRAPLTALPDALADGPARADDGAVIPPAMWASTLVLSAAASAAWLGGWAVPFVDAAAEGRSFALSALGATLFLGKTWSLALVVATLRAMLPRLRLDQAGSPFLRVALPSMLGPAAITVGWTLWDPAAIVRRGVSAVLGALVVLLVVHAVRRLAGAARGAAQPHVSPFL